MRRLSRCHCGPLLKAIDAYIQKADDKLADALEEEGYQDPRQSVKDASRLEDDVVDALREETAYFTSGIESAVDLDVFAASVWPDLKLNDGLRARLTEIFKERLSTYVPHYISRYLKQTDKKLRLGKISQRTVTWVDSWSEELAGIMQLNSHGEVEDVLVTGLKEGFGIEEFSRRLLDSGIRNERYKARRVALTEVLRAHSVAQQEAFMQSPSVKEKMWKHTGAYRNDPRQNHVDMDGKRVPVAEPFELTGADGHMYRPMYPRDTILPAGESINCHCLCQPVVDEDVLGMSLEERQKLQQQAIDEMDEEWERELDARNRAKAGIEPAPAANRPPQSSSSSGSGQEEPGAVEQVGEVDFSDKKAVSRELAKARSDFADLAYEKNCTVTADGKVWRVTGDSVTVNPWGIEDSGSSLKGSWSYHNHPAESTWYSFSAGDVRFFFESGAEVSEAGDDVYHYIMRRTKDTVAISGEEAYNRFNQIEKTDVMALKWDNLIDPDMDGYHEVMKRLGQELSFDYERKKVD
ncbi:MAG: hypothetical protein IJT94_04530 [Oscillibacter sp.]|nr:hypothetical protein [Oscillibacter sp.]